MLKLLDRHTPEVLVYAPENFDGYTDLDRRIVAHDFLNPGFGVRRTFDLMVRMDSHDQCVFFNRLRLNQLNVELGERRAERIRGRNEATLKHAAIPYERAVRGWRPFSDDFRHECPDWDFLPITLHDAEANGCTCYRGNPTADAMYEARAEELDARNEATR